MTGGSKMAVSGAWRLLAAAGASAVLVAAEPVAAQTPDSPGCVVADDGDIVCPTMEIQGRLRLSPEVLFQREALGYRLDALRMSFLDEIETSVEQPPF